MAAGAALSMAQTVMQGSAAKQAGKQQQAQYDRQADQQRENARLAEARGDRAVVQRARQTRELQSRARAVGAASGFDGSSADYVRNEAEIAGQGSVAGRGDAYNAAIEARGYRMDAEESKYAGRLARAEGNAAYKNSIFSAVGQGISAGSSIMSAGESSWFTKFGAK